MYNNTSQVSNPMPFSASTPSMMQRQANPGMARPMMQSRARPMMPQQTSFGMARPMMPQQQQQTIPDMFVPLTLPQMAQNVYSVPTIPSIPGISGMPMPYQSGMALPQYAANFYTGLTPNRMI